MTFVSSRLPGMVAKHPLCRAETANGESLIELGHDKGQGLDQALRASRRLILKIHLHGSSQNLMSPFQLSQSLMGFPGRHHELDPMLGRIVHDLIASPGPVAVDKQSEHLDLATFHGLEEVS